MSRMMIHDGNKFWITYDSVHGWVEMNSPCHHVYMLMTAVMRLDLCGNISFDPWSFTSKFYGRDLSVYDNIEFRLALNALILANKRYLIRNEEESFIEKKMRRHAKTQY